MTKSKRPRLALLKNNDIMCVECEEICEHKMEYEIAGEEPIECDTCQKWYHRKCLDKTITRKDWESLTGDNHNITYKCLSCIHGRGEKINELKEIKEMIKTNTLLMQNLERSINDKVNKAVDSKLTEVKSSQDLLQKKVEDNETKNERRFLTIEKELKTRQEIQTNVQTKETSKKLESMIKDFRENESSVEKKIKEEVRMYIDTQQEKDKRKNNLIIHRLKETQDNAKDQNERDKADVLKILATTNPELIAELQNSLLEEKKIYRLRRKEKESTKIRPIRVILPEEDIKFDILKGCSNLRNSVFSHISVQHDYTKEEQKRNYNLRKELKERIEKGENVCLYRGEIINKEDRPKKQTETETEKNKEAEEEPESETEK